MAELEKLFDTQLAVTPPVSDEQLSAIPAKRGVVLLVGDNDVPIVMVTAANMRSRARTRLAEPHEDQSRKSPDLRQITRAIFYRRCESYFETDLEFLIIASRLWPARYPKLLTWKPPWFIQINLADPYPYFSKTHGIFERSPLETGSELQTFGPFATGRDADKFIEALQDAFRLCRSIKCLRNAPNGPRCAYAEMGKCASPADGTISMDEYREILRQACRFAAGDRETLRSDITAQMARAAKELKFEQAGACKTRLDRLSVFEGENYRYVKPLGEFRKILIQPGAGVHELRVFLVNGGMIVQAGAIKYPLCMDQLRGLLNSMSEFARQSQAGVFADLAMGLVVRTLFATPPRCGLAVDWRAGLSVEELADAIDASREDLAVKPGRAETNKTDSQPTEVKSEP